MFHLANSDSSYNFETKLWVVSSVGLEHCLDRAGVTGSNPVQPTF